MEWRGNIAQILPFREYLRHHLPENGLVLTDLDLVCRTYGAQNDTDQIGRFCLIELKYGAAQMSRGQENTFALMTRLLRQADPKRERFLGFYLVQYSDENWEIASFRINYLAATRQDIHDLMLDKNKKFKGLFED